MFFELQHGVHLEGGKQYATKFKRDKNGKVHYSEKPIIESNSDLVQRFGVEKFRRLAGSEVQAYLKKTGRLAEQKTKSSAKKSEPESKVAKAAKEGAVAVLEPPGKDVTERFPDATGKQLRIYRKDRNQYVVMNTGGDEDVCLTEEPITKKGVDELIKEWED